MFRKHLTLIALAMSMAVAACGRGEQRTVSVDKYLTVVGQQNGVERFVNLQRSLRPAVATSAVTSLDRNSATATVKIPASWTSEDLVHITREAIAADLDYTFKGRRTVKVSRS